MSSRIYRSLLAASLLVAAVGQSAVHSGFELVSPAEYQSDLSQHAQNPTKQFYLRSLEVGAPTISVVKPNRSGPISPPVDIDVQFKPADGATINPASLKILYGWMHLDITQRILSAPGVQVSADGLKASGAKLPSGSHKLLIEVADNQGRIGQQALEFTVQ
jgi:hypothetical protein